MKHSSILKKRRLLFCIIFIAFAVFVLVVNLATLRTREIALPVKWHTPLSWTDNTDSLPILKQYNSAVLKGSPIIVIDKPSLWIKIIAPYSDPFLLDNLFCFFAIIIGIIVIINLWDFNQQRPFSKQLSRAMNWSVVLLLVCWLINWLRMLWFNNLVETISNKKYFYEHSAFTRIEFWLALLLLQISGLIEKAEEYQEEQDLTV
jgi:hypothetical protein